MSDEWNNTQQPVDPNEQSELTDLPEIPKQPAEEQPTEPTPAPQQPQEPAQPAPPTYQPPTDNRYARYTPYGTTPPPTYQPPARPPKKRGHAWWIVLVAVLGAISLFAIAFALGQWGGKLPSDLGGSGTTTTTTTGKGNVGTPSEDPPKINYEDVEDAEALSTVDIVQRNLHSTVLINVYSDEKTDPFGYDSLAGQGSGIVWREDGHIITNEHVVVNESTGLPYPRIEVEFYDGKVYASAEVIGHDTDTDLAVIKITPEEGHTLQPVEFGRSDQLLLGERVVTIGASGGLPWSVSQGILSGKDRDVYEETGYDIKCLQVDATINPGNSGGPLFNALGQLVGINSAKIVLSGYENLGFAIPITEAQGVLEDLAAYGKVTGRIVLGIRGNDVSGAGVAGFMIQEIDKGSCLEGTAIKAGDILTGVDGVKVSGRAALRKELSQHKAGDTVTLTVTRVRRVGYGYNYSYETEDFTVRITLQED